MAFHTRMGWTSREDLRNSKSMTRRTSSYIEDGETTAPAQEEITFVKHEVDNGIGGRFIEIKIDGVSYFIGRDVIEDFVTFVSE